MQTYTVCNGFNNICVACFTEVILPVDTTNNLFRLVLKYSIILLYMTKKQINIFWLYLLSSVSMHLAHC